MSQYGEAIFKLPDATNIILHSGEILLIGRPHVFGPKFRHRIEQNKPHYTERIILNIDTYALHGAGRLSEVLGEFDGWGGIPFAVRSIMERVAGLVRRGSLLAIVLPPVANSEIITHKRQLEDIADDLPGANAINAKTSVEDISFAEIKTFEDKLMYIVLKSGDYFSSDSFKDDFNRTMTASVIVSTVIVLAFWADSYRVDGVGLAIDDTLLAMGWAMIGWGTFPAMNTLIECLRMIKDAEALEDLNASAQQFADVITQTGVDLLIGLLTRGALSIRAKASAKPNAAGAEARHQSRADIEANNKAKSEQASNNGADDTTGQSSDADPTPNEPDAIQPLSEEEKPCCISALTAGCDHSGRSFVLKPPTTITNSANDQIIQLIGELNAQDDLIVNLSAVSPCPKGGTPVVTFDGNNYTGNKHTFTLQAPESNQITPFMDFIPFVKTFLLMKSGETSRTYRGGASCIEGGEEFDFTAEIFPQKEWFIELSLSCEFPEDRNVVNTGLYDSEGNIIEQKQYAVYNYNENESFLKFEGKVEGTYADKKTEVQLFSYERASTNIVSKRIFPKLEQFFEKILPRLKHFLSSPLIEIQPIWPKITLKGGSKLIEIPDKYNVARIGELSLELSPLLGLSGETDLLDWLILYASGPFSKKLIDIKKKAEEGIDTDQFGARVKCSIDVTVEGKVGGGFKWEFIPEGTDTGAGNVTGSVEFTVKGEVSGEIRVFTVGYKAGAYLQAKTGLGGELTGTFYGDDPGFGGKLIFDGLIIKAVAFAGATGSEDTSHRNVKAKKRRRRRGRLNTEEMGVNDEDVLYECEILPPGEWPPSDETVVTAGDEL